MAKPAWLLTDKVSGSGNDTVGVSSSAAFTGRVARSGILTFRATGVPDKTVTVNQAGKPEFVTIQSSAAVDQAGGTITISGTSNSSKLTFSLGSGSLAVTLPSAYTANSVSTNNGEAIVGDPGAGVEYNFSITISGIPENIEADELTRQLVVTANGGQSAICLITQAATAAMLSVSPTTIELSYEGTTQYITVTSNTSWTIL
jgi:hypothetical protein